MGWDYKKAAKGAVIGQATGMGSVPGVAAAMTNKGVIGDVARGDVKALGEDIGLSNHKGEAAWDKYKQSTQDQYRDTQGILGDMKNSGDTYYGSVKDATGAYKGNFNAASDDYVNKMQNQANDAKANYTNNLLPRATDLMNASQKNAAGAMSLSQAMDPNNAVAKGMRDLYGNEAQGIQKQGLADYGVLAALGSQATQNTMGAGGPMTGAQLQVLQGANMGQASGAFARAQQQANALRQQGIQAGTDQSNTMYQYGQQAHQQAGADLGNFEGMMGRNNAQQAAYNQDIFGTKLGQAQGNYGMDTGLAGLRQGLDNQYQTGQMGAINQLYGAQQGISSAEAQAANAAQASKLGAFGQIVGTGLGALAGPMGAQMGGQLGQGAAGVASANNAAPTGNIPQQGAQTQQQQPYRPGMYGGYGGGMYA